MNVREMFSQFVQLMRKPVFTETSRERLTRDIAYQLYQRRILSAQHGTPHDDWLKAQKIARSPILRSIHYDKWLASQALSSCDKAVGWFRSGMVGKTSWELLQLVIIPLFLALGAFYLEAQIDVRQERIADERSKQATLTNYLNQMKELLLAEDLRNSSEDSEVRSLARAITVTTLRELDSDRNALLIGFLKESQLVQPRTGSDETTPPLLSGLNFTNTKLRQVDFSGVDLRGSTFTGAYLYRSNFRGADLRDARFQSANLGQADLSEADLRDASLSYTDLREAIFYESDLRGAWFTETKLRDAAFGKADLRGALFTDLYFWRVSFCTTKLSQQQEERFGRRCSVREYLTPFPQ